MSSNNFVTVTNSNIVALLYETENSENPSNLLKFSTPSTGANSTYAFGPLQIDVGGNRNSAGQFLLNNGFTQSQVDELSSNASISQDELDTLNTQLQAIPASTMAQFQESMVTAYVTQLNNVIQKISTVNPDAASSIANSSENQLILIDYMNQYPGGISLTSSNGLLAYLEGKSVNPSGTQEIQSTSNDITPADIAAFVSATTYSINNPSAASGRANRLQTALSQYDAGTAVLPDGYDNSAGSGEIASLQTTSLGLTGDITSSVSPSGEFSLMGANGSVGLQANGWLNVSSSNASFNFLQGVTAMVQGAGNSLQCGANDNIGVQGNNNIINDTNGVINIQNGDTGNQVDGNQNTINAAGNFAGIINGSDNQVDLTANSNSSLTLLGAGEQVTSTGNTITLDNSGSSATVTGVDTIWMSSANQSLTLATSGDTVDANAGDTGETLNGSGFTLNDTNGAFSGTISGGGDTFNFDAHSGSSVDLNGSGDVINSVGNDIALGVASATATFNGGGNDISLSASAQTVFLNASNDTVDGNGGIVYQQIGGMTTTVIGSGNTIGSNDGAPNDTLYLQGTNTVNDSGETIYQSLGSMTTTVIGSGNTIGSNDGAPNDTLYLEGTNTVNDSGETIYQSLGSMTTTVIGSGNTIGSNDGAPNDTLYLQGNNTINDSGETIYQSLGSMTTTVIGSGNTIGTTDGAAWDTVYLQGNDTVNDSHETIDQQLGSMVTTVYGSGNTIGTTDNAAWDTVDLYGSNTVSSSYETIDQQLGGLTTTLDGDDETVSTTDNASGDTIDMAGGLTGEVIDDSSDTLHADSQDTFTVDGNNNTVTGSDDQISLSGQGDIIDISHATIDVSGDDGVTIDGSDDKIVGGNGDSFTITGTDDTVDASDSSVTFDGSNTGDYVSGSGDTGSNWDDPTGSGGYSDPGSGYYGYGLTKWKNKSPSTAQIAKAEHSDSVYEGAKWADKTITWSFASAGHGYSNAITNSAEQTAVEQAFQTWAKASGLNFDEVAAGSKADIEVGFSDLNPASTNEIGLTQYSSQAGVLTGAKVELEDPNQAPLTTDANDPLSYANTDAAFEQVALHEIGHALGLADTDVVGSIMNGVLGADNQSLSTGDTSNVQKLYTVSSSSASLSQVHKLVQAMSVFDTGEQGVDLNPTTELYLQKEHLLASSLHHVRAA